MSNEVRTWWLVKEFLPGKTYSLKVHETKPEWKDLKLGSERIKVVEASAYEDVKGVLEELVARDNHLVKCCECGKEVTANICEKDHIDNGITPAYWEYECKECILSEKLAAAEKEVRTWKRHFDVKEDLCKYLVEENQKVEAREQSLLKALEYNVSKHNEWIDKGHWCDSKRVLQSVVDSSRSAILTNKKARGSNE